MIISLVATKSLYPHVGARDIRIVKGSNYITTHWSRSWKSYLISKSKECTFSNHALIVISQLPNNHFHISNVAYPIHLMVIGTSARLKMTSLDDLNVMYEGNPLDLVEKTKYLGLHLSSDLNWDTHIMEICKQLNYYLHLLRRLKRVLPRDLLMTVYKAYFQSKFDYGISVWGCTTQSNIQKIQRMQNRAARIITGCYDFINIRGIDLVNELNLQNITERRDYFLCNLMFKAIHGLAPTYLSDSIIMNADMNEYSTRGAQNRNVYQPRPRIEKYKNSFLYKAGELWNALPVFVKESLDLEMFKRNYKAFKGGVVWLHFYVF